MSGAISWPDDIFRVFRAAEIRQVAYVPDAGHTRLINLCREDNVIRAVGLTTEEEGVALLAGAWLGGQRGALLMQSSGVGNCINMFSLIENCAFPCLVLVTMRGEYAEFNPWQVPMGSITEECLRLCRFVTCRVDDPENVDRLVGEACDHVFESGVAIAVILSQRLIGAKDWSK